MKTGNIILVHNPFYWKAPISSLLYFLLRGVVGHWHHCALYWQTQDGGEFIVEATGKGVICTSIDIWRKRWPSRETLVLPLECEPVGFTKHLGKRYDRYSFLFACLVKIVFHRWIGLRDTKAEDKLYCFELAAMAHGNPLAYCILPSEFLDLYEKELVG